MDYIGGTLTGENWKLNCGKMVGNLCQKKCQRAWKWREKEGGVLYFFCIFLLFGGVCQQSKLKI